jgi:hypothetical protein
VVVLDAPHNERDRAGNDLRGTEVAKKWEARLRRRRHLEMKDGRTAFEDAEIVYLKRVGRDEEALSFGAMVKSMTERWLAKRGRTLGWTSTIIMSVVVLPIAAWYQADVVRSGHEDIGSQLGLFAYGATAVQVENASKDAIPSLSSVTGKDVFLLGQNDRQIVLFVPFTGVTEFVPTSLLTVR